jgi:regulator of sigma E protease
MTDIIAGIGDYAVPFLITAGSFLIILTIVVFVHEMGHYLVARWCGVRVEVFSIGFGRELFGWNDRAGTHWKFSIVPLGGYIKMFGDRNAASMPDGDKVEMTAAEKKVAFTHKRLDQRAAIVAAGPIANFVFGILVFAGLFMTVGQPATAPVIGDVEPGSAAAMAGIEVGDRVLRANGFAIDRFEDIRQIVGVGLGEPLSLVILRDGVEIALEARPRVVEREDILGNIQKIGLLGVRSIGLEYVRRGPAGAVWHGVGAAWNQIYLTFKTVGQMIEGTRTTKDISGPLGIARLSGEIARLGIIAMINWAALLSIQLGLINLFPIPILDGGHLLFYAAEAVRGRPLGERAQEFGFRIGLALVLVLFMFATWNDLAKLQVVRFFQELVT